MKRSISFLLQRNLLAGLATAIPLALSSQEQGENPRKPNILIILADDLGYGDLSCQGATDMKTPNIDRIFKEGMRFTSFYANSTVSSPTRASLLTGRYPDMVGVPGVIRTHEDDSWGFLAPSVRLLPEILQKSGYETALIGKWHLGLEAPNLPHLRGFGHFHGFLGDMMDDYFTHLRHGNNYMRLNNQTINPEGHATDIFTGWALDYFKSRENPGKPFFMLLAYNAPHDPIQPPADCLAEVLRRGNISEKRARLVALIEHLDRNIGRVLGHLEKTGELQNTLVIFTSDNGGVVGLEANNGPWRGGKQDMYEGGLRVPAAFLWKDRIAPGSSCTATAITMDVFPTLCDIAGIRVHSVDGISLLPLLTGEKQETDHRTLFFVRREGNLKYGGMAYYAARTGDHKILQNTPWEPMQFFNLKDDPYEKEPLKTAGNKVYEELFRQLMRHIQLSGAIPWQRKADD